MSECTHDCSTCVNKCEEADLHVPANTYSAIKKVVAVSSGKGGVGKSSVTSMLAVMMARRGYRVGILDADITGPSIPQAFGITASARGSELGIIPAETHMGIKIMSVNLLLEDPHQPVVWRGPVLAGAVKQFWTDVVWGELDVLFIDMPPGTGDVPLTVYQSIPLDGNIIVTTPQTLVHMVVEKAQKMVEMLDVPVLGVVENMSYITCPDCGKRIPMFGGNADDENILARLPMDSHVATLCDSGEIERVLCDELAPAVDVVENLLK